METAGASRAVPRPQAPHPLVNTETSIRRQLGCRVQQQAGGKRTADETRFCDRPSCLQAGVLGSTMGARWQRTANALLRPLLVSSRRHAQHSSPVGSHPASHDVYTLACQLGDIWEAWRQLGGSTRHCARPGDSYWCAYARSISSRNSNETPCRAALAGDREPEGVHGAVTAIAVIDIVYRSRRSLPVDRHVQRTDTRLLSSSAFALPAGFGIRA